MKRDPGRSVDAHTAGDATIRVGDTLPLPKPKLVVKPASFADDPAASPRGVFTNGRGGSK
jgi:hypothetical protein